MIFVVVGFWKQNKEAKELSKERREVGEVDQCRDYYSKKIS